MTFGFIGTGNMGGALARGLAANVAGRDIYLFNPTSAKAEALAAELGGVVASAEDIAGRCDFIFLGMKPHQVESALAALRPVLAARQEKAVLVSMAASVTLEELEKWAFEGCPVIRIMPNTACAVGEGVTLYACNSAVTAAQRETFLTAMAGCGRTEALAESLIDAGSAIAGCGGAFACLFMEGLADGGVACGLPRDKANTFAAQMLLGAARLALESGQPFGAMKDAVCSPGGSTIAGVRALENGAFRAAAMNAVIAAYEKTAALGK